MARWIVAVALAALAAGCVTPTPQRTSMTVCPEYRGIVCATAVDCSMNYERGCQVCQCAPAAVDRNRSLPSGAPPDLRH